MTILESIANTARKAKKPLLAGMMGLALVVGCKDKGSSPEEPDPAMGSMITNVEAPSSVQVGEEALYSATCAAEDGIRQANISFESPDHSFTKDYGVRSQPIEFDTLFTHGMPGEASLEIVCENDYAYGENKTLTRQATTQITQADNNPLTVQANAPTSLQATVDEGTWSLSAQNPDGLDLINLYFTTPNGEHDFSLEKTLETTSWDTTFSHTFSNAGQATFEYLARDVNGEEKSDELTTVISQQPIADLNATANAPTSLQATVDEGTWSLNASSDDGLAGLELYFTTPNGEHDFSVDRTLETTAWDTTFSHVISNPGEVSLEYVFTDVNGQEKTDTRLTTITQQPMAPLNATANAPTSLQATVDEGTWSLNASSDDGLAGLELYFTTPNGEHDFSVDRTLESTSWDTTFSHVISSPGEVSFFYSVSDVHGQTKTDTKTTQVSSAPTITYVLAGSVYNPVLEEPAAGVQLELFSPSSELLDQETSNQEGEAQLQHTQNTTAQTTNHSVRMSALGYDTQEQEVDLDQESFSAQLTPTDIIYTSQTNSIEPRDSIQINLQELVDTQGVPLEEILLQSTSSNLTARAAGANTYWLRVENDASNTQENITIQARTTTNQETNNITVPIQPKEPINYTNTFFNTQEDDTLRINLQNRISSAVEIDSTNISSTDSRIEILRDSANEYRLIPQQDFSGQIQLDLFASNKHGSNTNTTGTLDVERLPRATIYVQNNETDEHTQGLEAHIGVYNQEGERVDTLSNNTGVFEIKLREENNTIRARYTQGQQPFSYVRTEQIPNTGADQEHTTRVVDYHIRDIQGNVVGELQEGAPGAESPEGFKQWAEGIRGGANAWNIEFGVQLPRKDLFNWYTNSDHGRGPDEVILAKKFHIKQQNYTHTMLERPQNISLEIYNEHLRPWTDFELPEAQIVEDSLYFDAKNNAYMNIGIIHATSNPAPGEGGSVSVFGEAPQSIYNSIARLASVPNDPATDKQLREVSSEEQTGAFGIFSRVQANDFGVLDYQSVTHDAYQSALPPYPTNLDGKMIKNVWETTYTGKLTDVFELPEN